MALTMTPIMRQPFANLETPRVRSLMRSHLNRQPAKRAPLGDLALDAENVDPTRNTIKRKRGADDDDDDDVKPSLKPSKTSRIALSTIPKTTTTTPTTTPITTPIKTTSKPILKPAGRSPVKSTPRSSSHRRSNVSKRPDQRSRVTRPFSLAAALAGPQKPASKKSTPPSWTFDIHVDTEQEEMTNLMQHSTTVLDIGSDDSTATETAATAPSEARGKENIPPAELEVESAAVREPAPSRKDAMEDARSPLGDLPAAEYYGEDCHAFSYAVVYDDEDENLPRETAEKEKKKHTRSKLSSVSSVESIVEFAPEKETTDAVDENKADTAATGAAEADS
ncbi:hypothetical protein P168DRAFT_305116 [Aspergillus campestris IBT 28561]|uniref:Uncharacterized protein n=1 Tax=Aspergillus campestris (strain IBT 28561) TaxID=1392248 RepID=A0A2I1D1N6_ASPC2|nr:uncharacterized protein P168DRAFT_305116 [Aspergillus campestris IBT 28561]PKY03792.1 hypothetical protein P168DRAFT_305116 [Aspergillus campestris IBT 28561]